MPDQQDRHHPEQQRELIGKTTAHAILYPAEQHCAGGGSQLYGDEGQHAHAFIPLNHLRPVNKGKGDDDVDPRHRKHCREQEQAQIAIACQMAHAVSHPLVPHAPHLVSSYRMGCAPFLDPEKGGDRQQQEKDRREGPNPADIFEVLRTHLAQKQQGQAGGHQTTDVAQCPAEAGDPSEVLGRPQIRQKAGDK